MKKEILVIEGSKAMRFLLHTVLKKHYKVVSVADGMSAMFYLRESASPDMIIMDPEISDMPEWQLVKQLSLNSFYQHIPIVAISSADIEYTASQRSARVTVLSAMASTLPNSNAAVRKTLPARGNDPSLLRRCPRIN